VTGRLQTGEPYRYVGSKFQNCNGQRVYLGNDVIVAAGASNTAATVDEPVGNDDDDDDETWFTDASAAGPTTSSPVFSLCRINSKPT